MTRDTPASSPWRKTRLGWIGTKDIAAASGYPRGGVETRLIERYVSLRRRDVIEIGCGAGRLTFQYAAGARSVRAFDANAEWIARARAAAPTQSADNVRFAAVPVQDWHPARASCDVVLFSWSLC